MVRHRYQIYYDACMHADFDEAWEKVDEQNSEDSESETDIKRQYNVEARKLLEKDGLLCRKRLDAK